MNAEHFQEVTNSILSGELTVDTEVLVTLLGTASDAYYNAGEDGEFKYPVIDTETGELEELVIGNTPFEELISDDSYNALERMLRTLDPKNVFLMKVGSDVRGGKVPLPFKMGSLDQVYEGDSAKWVEQHDLQDEDFVVSDKLDGTSVALIYDRKGNFLSAFSRGNGIMGADITRHISRMACVPKTVEKGPLKLRAEAIIPVSRWDAVRDETAKATGRTYKNARNYVAGKMNASESDAIFLKNIHIVITSIEEPELGKMAQLELARKNGFLTNFYVGMKGADFNDTTLTDYLNERREKSDYELDGIVLDVDRHEIREKLPKTTSSLNPTYARKFKVASADNLATTEVVGVHWRVSKAGYLKPRVEIKPVDLSGVTITYATGFNAKFIRDNLVGPGAVIRITRSGDVIPYITEVVSGVAADLPKESEFGKMVYTDKEVDLVLEDIDSHPDTRYYRILDAFKSLDVPHLRQGAVEKLIEAGYDTEAKIIKATEAQIKAVVGDSSGKKIFDGLRAKLNQVDLALLAGASQTLGRGIGKRKVTKILNALGTLDITYKELVQVEGFQKKTAETVIKNLPKFNAFLAEIDGYYSIAEKVAAPTEGALKGFTIVFTGVRDKELEAKIVAQAGIIGSSVNKDTTHLVCKDPSANSSKLVKARQLLPEDNIMDLSRAQELWG